MRIIYEKDKMNCPLKVFDGGGTVTIDEKTIHQAKTYCSLPFVIHASLMPDAHYGKGSTVGSVVATTKVIIPAMVGVDIGCGMMAMKTSLKAGDLPESLKDLRSQIEKAVPHGRSRPSKRASRFKDKGSWMDNIPSLVERRWNKELKDDFEKIIKTHPKIQKSNHINHLGSLGTGNHFIEVCLDLEDSVWVMLHSGSRGVGNRIGNYFISLAKEEMQKHFIHLPDQDLAYIPQNSLYFSDYVKALLWAQKFAKINREIMMERILEVLKTHIKKPFKVQGQAINCHHNYVVQEKHYNKEFWVTRKGAVRAKLGDWGIIPGSMGAKSFIVRGKGNPDSLTSCSHGAGRLMSRNEAKKVFSKEDLKEQTKGVECKKDSSVIDEIPKAYKPIEKVIEAQSDLIEIEAELRQIICVKG